MNSTVVVLDIGKTFSKLSLWGEEGGVVAQKSLANCSRDVGPIRAINVDTVEMWMTATLREFGETRAIDAIIPVAHGATGALIRRDRLACPVFDYETPVPHDVREPYDLQRDAFHDTGSPAQSLGLNLGVQLHWLEQLYPEAFEDGAQFVTWPQYWAWRLSGVASTEVTSLACHTDLWRPEDRGPSRLAQNRGWANLFAPLHNADDILGPLRPEIAVGCEGLRNTRVHCGIHDSNASLLGARAFTEFRGRDFTTLATGTWFVTMRSPAPKADFRISDLPEDRDCLVNCDINGNMVPTSLFMGGRELATVLGDDIECLDAPDAQAPMLDALNAVLESRAMLLPTFTPGVGPFPKGKGRWLNEPTYPAQRHAAACLYAALISEAAFTFLGSTGSALVDGRFSNSRVFTRALATLRPDIEFFTSDAELDIAHGALLLAGYSTRHTRNLIRLEALPGDVACYAQDWRDALASNAG